MILYDSVFQPTNTRFDSFLPSLEQKWRFSDILLVLFSIYKAPFSCKTLRHCLALAVMLSSSVLALQERTAPSASCNKTLLSSCCSKPLYQAATWCRLFSPYTTVLFIFIDNYQVGMSRTGYNWKVSLFLYSNERRLFLHGFVHYNSPGFLSCQDDKSIWQ